MAFRSCRILFCILLLLALSARALPRAQGPALPRINKLTFTADASIDADDLRQRLPLAIGDSLDSTRIRQSIANLYATGDFQYIECTSQPFQDGLWVDFRLVVKRYFARFRVQGSSEIKELESLLARYFPLGEAYSETKEHRFVVEVEKFLLNRGRFSAEVLSKAAFDPQSRSVNLTLEIRSGKPAVLGKVDMRGEMNLPETNLRKALKLKAGDPYSRDAVLAAIERLKRYYAHRQYLSPKIIIEDLRIAAESNQVELVLLIQSGPLVEIRLEGATISRSKLEQLLPVYREVTLDNDLLEEGRDNLHEYLLRQGYSSADISFSVQQEPALYKTTVIYQIKLGQKLLIENIQVKGLQALKRSNFLACLAGGGSGIRSGAHFTLRGFEASAERVLQEYHKRGFLDATFSDKGITIAETGRVDIEYLLQEGPKYVTGTVTFQGNNGISQSELLPRIATRIDQPFSPEQLEQDKRALQEYYLSKGYPQSTVSADATQNQGVVSVRFQVAEGPPQKLQQLLVVGNERTKLSAISRNLGFQVGDSLVVKKLFEGEQMLYNTAAFDQVRIRSAAPSQDARQTVVVGIRESPRHLLNFGLGYQEFEGPRGLFELSYLNVGGSLRTAQVRMKGSLVNQTLQLNVREPRPLNRNFESFATLQASRKKQVTFTERRFGISLQALRELSRVNALIFRYGYDHVGVYDAKVSLADIPKVSQPLNLSSFSVALVNDSRNNPFDPERGAFNSINLQVTAPIFQRDAHFAKLFTQSQYYRPLFKRLLLAEALRIGLARRFAPGSSLPISERFFAGGASTLRGFANDEAGPRDRGTNKPIGGSALVINNLELRFPIVSRFGGVLFYDAGNVFADIHSIQWHHFTHSVGLGVKIQTPIGSLRFDYGINLKSVPGLSRQHFFIGFGPLF